MTILTKREMENYVESLESRHATAIATGLQLDAERDRRHLEDLVEFTNTEAFRALSEHYRNHHLRGILRAQESLSNQYEWARIWASRARTVRV